MGFITNSIICEICNNIGKYVTFTSECNADALKSGMFKYVFEKQYDTDFGDIVPYVVANALNIGLIIMNDFSNLDNIHSVIIPTEKASKHWVLIARNNLHYDALSLSNKLYEPDEVQIPDISIVNKQNVKSPDIHTLCETSAKPVSNSEPDSSSITPDVDDMTSAMRGVRMKYTNNLITAHININSIRHKFENISTLFDESIVDLFVITESKLDDSFPNAQFYTEGYKLYRKDRNKNGGGIMFYVRSDIPHRTRPDLECKSSHVESLVIEAHIKNDKWLYVAIYNPNKKHEDELVKFLGTLYEKEIGNYTDIICIGDINIDLASTNSMVYNSVIDIYGLHNLITSPTCFKASNGTLLDPILVTNKKRFMYSFNLLCPFSDFHNLVGCVTKCHLKKQRPKTIFYRSFKKFDELAFKKDVSLIKTGTTDCDDPNAHFSAFQTQLLQACNKHAPLKQRTIKRNQLPYMNKELRSAMYKRNSLRNKYFKYRNNDNWEAYRKQRNNVTSIRRNSMKNYFRNKCTESNKEFWKVIKPFMTDKKSYTSNVISLKEGDKIYSDPSDVCSIFNDFFATLANDIGTKNKNCTIEIANIESTFEHFKDHPSISVITNMCQKTNPFSFHEVTPMYVEQKIKKLNSKKAPGPDTIPAKLLKIVCQEVSQDMSDIINLCIRRGIFPDDMKLADITPIYKKLDALCKDNYRPVNVISVLSKLFEIILAEQLGLHFNDIFSNFLSAYRKRYSCENSLLFMTESWREALDNKMYVGAVLMDLSKAFDCLPPDLFISKLNAYKVTNNSCRLIASYLSNRKQRIKLGIERSSWRETVKGVPQGSGLGPLIFNIFINDIFEFITQCRIMNYADDNTIYTFNHNADTVINMLQHDSKIAVKWFADNFMQANPSKFQFIFLNPSRTQGYIETSLPIFDIHIDRSDQVKLLGVTIDEKLKFNQHVKSLCNKAARQLNAFKRISKNLNTSEREVVYNCFISSVFNFCPLVWHFCNKADYDKVEKINERALRLVYNEHDMSYEELLLTKKKLSMRKIRMLNFATELYKIKNGYSVSNMEIFDKQKHVPYNLRRNKLNVVPAVNTSHYGTQSFRYFSSHLWNQIPDQMKSANTINRFKQLLFSWSGPSCQCKYCVEF